MYKNEQRVIDALRGVAVFCVFFSHSDASSLATSKWLVESKEVLGVFGVYAFFAISGYLIWASAKRYLPKPFGLRIYFLHRATRLMPLYLTHLLMIVLLLDVVGSFWHPVVTIESIWRHLTFTQDLSPSVSRDINPVLWTLTHEVAFYIVVPLLFFVRDKIQAVTVFISGCILSFLAFNYDFGLFTSFFRVFFAFAAGIVLAESTDEDMFGYAVIFAIFSLGAEVFFPVQQVVIGFSAIACVALVLSRQGLAVTSSTPLLLITRPMALVGVISYSVYIWHYQLIGVAEYHNEWLRNNFQLWADSQLIRGIFFTGGVLAFSALSYALIERPGMGPLRRFIQSRILNSSNSAGRSVGRSRLL